MNQKESILIVDDNEDMRKSLKLIFNKKGYKTDTAETAQEALKKAHKKYFNIALIEFKLPDMEGTILLGKLKEIYPKMTCFIITAYAFLQNVRMAARINADGYFIKPLIIEDVVYRIEKILKEQHIEKKLKESEEKYRTVFENTGTATAIIEEDTILSLVNTEFEKLTGYPEEEIENKKSWTEFVVKEDLKRMKKYHIARRKTGEKAPTEYEFSLIDKKGNIKNIFIKVALIPGTKKSVAFLIDITKSKQTEENIKRAKEELQIIMDLVPAMIYYKDTEGKIIRVNRTLANTVKMPLEDMIGKTIEELVPKEQAKNMRKDDQEVILSGKPKMNITESYSAPEGTRWAITDRIPYKDKEGKVTGVIGWCQELVGTFLTSKKLFDFNSRKEKQILMKFNIK